jgi:serine/threonine-protein phosphatase 6 regulatory ankyrin repeat subunit B
VNDNANVHLFTPLHGASCNGHLDVVCALIRSGATINATCDKGRTPLHYASYNEHLDVVQELIKAGADLDEPEQFNYTALHFASGRNNLEVVQTLIKHGASTSSKTISGYTPLHIAVIEPGNLKIVMGLVEHSDHMITDNKGNTALDLATDGHIKGILDNYQACLFIKEPNG